MNNNENQLLTWLEEQRVQTQALISSEEKTLNYWVSGEYKNDLSNYAVGVLTDYQVDFFRTGTETRLKPLKFRLMWLQSQLNEIKEIEK